jgi:hypothetical protein
MLNAGRDCRLDFAFFRNRFWERLTVDADILLVFVASLQILQAPLNRINAAALPPRGIWKGRLSLISHCLARITGTP